MEDIVSAKVVSHSSERVGLTIDANKAHQKTPHPRRVGAVYCSSIEANFTTTQCATLRARFSAAWWSRMGAVLITHLPPVHVRSARWVAGSDKGAAHGNMHLLFSAPPGMSHQLAKDCVGSTSALDWPRHHFSRVSRKYRKRDKALRIIHSVSRQGNKIERADLERLEGLLMWFADSMPALRPWLSNYYLALAKPTATLLSLSKIQFEEASSRTSDTFLCSPSHAELSGLRQGWRIIRVAGKAVDSPQEAVEMCPNVRRRIWVRALNPRSKYVRAPDHFSSTLEASDLTIRRAPYNPPCATRNHRRVRRGRRLCPRYILEHRRVVLTRNAVSVPKLLLVVPAPKIHGRSSAVLARRNRGTASLRSASHCGKARTTSQQTHQSWVCSRQHITCVASSRSSQDGLRFTATSLKSTAFQGPTTSGPTHSAAIRIRSKCSSPLLSALNHVSMTCSAPAINRNESPSTKAGMQERAGAGSPRLLTPFPGFAKSRGVF